MEIAVAAYSLHRMFGDGTLALTDYPALVRNEFGVGAAELNSPFFPDLEEPYLEELRARADQADVELIHISVDGEGDLAAADEAERTQAVENHSKWFGVCRRLGCASFRANAGGHADSGSGAVERCVRSFGELARRAEDANVRVLMENHGGVSADPDRVVRVMEAVGSPMVGTCPDFGNFPAGIRYQALEKIFPYAVVVHAKMYEFAEDGEDTQIDVGHCLTLARDTGFDGYLSVEFEGPGDPMEGVRKSIALLKKYL